MAAWTSQRIDSLKTWWDGPGPEDSARMAWAWLGQAGFLLRFGGLRVVIDPYLSDSLAIKYKGKRFPHVRMMEAPIAASELTGADIVLSTHEHTDHMDPGTLPGLLSASPDATIIVPRFSVEVASARGIPADRQTTMNAAETYQHPSGLQIEATPAAHEDYVTDQDGNAKFLGYLLTWQGRTVFHSGDTIPYAGLETVLGQRSVDVALLPSNGRDAERRANGVPGNLQVQEALAYHQRFGFATTVLHHFGLFDFNTADPDDLRNEAASRGLESDVIIPVIGTSYEH